MNDIFGEILFYIFGPIIAVVAIVGIIGYGINETYQWVTGTKPVVEQYQPPLKKETLSHKAGKKAKESGKEFLKGFFQ